MKCSEIEIPVPWGHIAAKLWGDAANEAIIVPHGETDNAGSFDTLIPLLPTSFYYICRDLPGHGKSSHFPHSQSLHPANLLLAVLIEQPSISNMIIKLWGNPNEEMVIMTHGLLDNAGSFDTLIPLLPQTLCYICLDLPGHGFSSHFDFSQPIYLLSFTPVIKIVADYFGRASYAILGHSFGTVICLAFAQLYPKLVSKLIFVDNIGIAPPRNPEVFSKNLQYSYELWLNGPKKAKRSYSFEEATEKVQGSRFIGKLSRESAENIARRMVKAEGPRYVFTFDERLKALITMPKLNLDWEREMFREKPPRCPVLIILTTPHNKFVTRVEEMRPDFEKLPNCQIHEIEGDHFTHTNQPHRVNTIISRFLVEKSSKL